MTVGKRSAGARRRCNLGRLTLALALASGMPSALAQGNVPTSAPVSPLPASTQDSAPVIHQTTLPYTPLPQSGTPLVQVRLNDQETGTFAVDTAFNTSLLTDAMAARLKLSPQPAVKDGRPYMLGGEQGRSVTLRMRIGIFKVPTVPILVVKSERLSSLLGRPVDGIIGANVLSQFAALFDCPRQQITLLYPGGLSGDDLRAAGFSGGEAIPLTVEKGTELFLASVRFRNGDHSDREDLAVDTGSFATTISPGLARRLALVPEGRESTVDTLAGTFAAVEARVQALQLGNVALADVPVLYPSRKSVRSSRMLGMDILSGYRVLVDFPGKKMYLFSSMAPVPFAPMRSASPSSPPSKPAGGK